MLRSQSISNLQTDSRKSNSFLNSFRSKPKVEVIERKQSTQGTRKHRPLSQSFSSINLNQKYNETLEKTSYASSVRRERGVSRISVDKENISSPKTTLPQLSSHTSISSIRTLKTRSSAPNLKQTKRHSMFFGGSVASPTLGGIASFTTPPIDILPDEILGDDAEMTSIDDMSAYSPYTPENHSTGSVLDPLFDLASIDVDTDFEYDYFLPEEQEDETAHKQFFYDKRKTTIFKDIDDFVKLIDDSYNPRNSQFKLAINNRKSLDFESLERNEIRMSLQKSLEKETNEESYKTTLQLIENAIFVGCEFPVDNKNQQFDIFGDELKEFSGIFKEDDYDNRDENFYNTF